MHTGCVKGVASHDTLTGCNALDIKLNNSNEKMRVSSYAYYNPLLSISDPAGTATPVQRSRVHD